MQRCLCSAAPPLWTICCLASCHWTMYHHWTLPRLLPGQGCLWTICCLASRHWTLPLLLPGQGCHWTAQVSSEKTKRLGKPRDLCPEREGVPQPLFLVLLTSRLSTVAVHCDPDKRERVQTASSLCVVVQSAHSQRTAPLGESNTLKPHHKRIAPFTVMPP